MLRSEKSGITNPPLEWKAIPVGSARIGNDPSFRIAICSRDRLRADAPRPATAELRSVEQAQTSAREINSTRAAERPCISKLRWTCSAAFSILVRQTFSVNTLRQESKTRVGYATERVFSPETADRSVGDPSRSGASRSG